MSNTSKKMMSAEGLFQRAARSVFPPAAPATPASLPVKPQTFADLRHEAGQSVNGRPAGGPRLFVSLEAVRQAVFARTLAGKIHSHGALPAEF